MDCVKAVRENEEKGKDVTSISLGTLAALDSKEIHQRCLNGSILKARIMVTATEKQTVKQRVLMI